MINKTNYLFVSLIALFALMILAVGCTKTPAGKAFETNTTNATPTVNATPANVTATTTTTTTTTANATAATCTDSDGGVNLTVKGTVTVNGTLVLPDYCFNGVNKVASCSGNNCTLVEFYCGANGYAQSSQSCPSGMSCNGGRCVIAVNQSMARLSVTAANVPGRADVYINDVYVGMSSTLLYNIIPGVNNVTVKYTGYIDYTTSRYMPAGFTTSMVAGMAMIQANQTQPPANSTNSTPANSTNSTY